MDTQYVIFQHGKVYHILAQGEGVFKHTLCGYLLDPYTKPSNAHPSNMRLCSKCYDETLGREYLTLKVPLALKWGFLEVLENWLELVRDFKEHDPCELSAADEQLYDLLASFIEKNTDGGANGHT